MKTLRAALVVISCFTGGAVVADEPSAAAPQGEHPCRKIESACTAAGFVYRAPPDGKATFKDCIKPILEGKAVAGVNPDPVEVQACITARVKHARHAGSAPAPSQQTR